MLIPPDHLLRAIQEEFSKVLVHLPDAQVDGSSAQAVQSALQLLTRREREGAGFIREQLANLSNTLTELEKIFAQQEQNDTKFAESIGDLSNRLRNHNFDTPLVDQEARWLSYISRFEEILVRFGAQAVPDGEVCRDVTRLVAAWESKDLASHISDADEEQTDSANQIDEISKDSLTAYLRDRFDETSLEVTGVTKLAGGFGKETTLFSVSGNALSGEFVMRRDYGVFPVSNDCHQVAVEYPVIRAAFENGFPAPDAVWLDTEHARLRGGDFIVMRRSPGTTGGNVFDAQTQVSSELVEVLANAVADLHLLPPQEQLGNLTTSICERFWQLPVSKTVEQYLNEWYDIFKNSSHTPSAATASLFAWLFANVPEAEGRPVLLHGDIGFHNMIIDDGHLTALVDWEFAHVGDPAEDLGYLRNCTGDTLDWDRFVAIYSDRTGTDIAPERIRFFQVWGHVRNAVASNLAATNFVDGHTSELKFSHLLFHHTANFIRLAQQFTDIPGR